MHKFCQRNKIKGYALRKSKTKLKKACLICNAMIALGKASIPHDSVIIPVNNQLNANKVWTLEVSSLLLELALD